ncbi:MAG: DUF455 family protein [Planctomycetota bacterium]
MELRELAETVLFGASLERKLVRPEGLTDQRPGPALARAPELPRRAPELALQAGRVAPPPTGRLEDDAAAGRVLLAFANHELQATELFALALLRFPEAPAEWRRGLGHVLLEEQEHLRLYLARCAARGLELGAAPLSGFFWRCLRGMRSPLDVVTGLGLTFEQANLDYARHYALAFAAAGDAETAAVLERVHAEEVGHVRHAARWLERWRAPEEDDWDAYRRALPAPLTPRRARGLGALQVESRAEAGLSQRFVSELALFGASKGRPPDVLWLVPSIEAEVADGRAGYVPGAAALALARERAPWLALLAGEDDLVLVPELPSPEWRAAWRARGLPLPEFVATGDDPRAAIAALAARERLGELRPWGWSPRVLALLEPLRRNSAGGWAMELGATAPEVLRRVHGKDWAAGLLSELLAANPEWRCEGLTGPLSTPAVCRSEDEVAAALAALDPGAWRALKAPYGAAGSGLRRLAPGEEPGENLRGWIRNTLTRQGALRVEPWWERAADLSLVFEVGDEGLRRAPRLTWPEVCERGAYRGHARRGPPEALRLLHGERRGLEALEAAAAHAAARLAAEGFRGPAGIDALVARGPAGAPWLHPLLELNARTTFGHLADAAFRRGLDFPPV